MKAVIETLQEGGTILYPTATVWGIGCDATNQDAVTQIFQIKQRATSKALIVLLDDAEKLSIYIKKVPPIAYQILEKAERPTTIIYPQAQGLAPNVIAENGSVAIRITQHPLCKQLIQQLGKPIVSTSANRSGEPTPTTFNDVSLYVKKAVSQIVIPENESLKNKKEFIRPSIIIQILADNSVVVIRA